MITRARRKWLIRTALRLGVLRDLPRDRAGAGTIAEAARALARTLGRPPVGVFGTSDRIVPCTETPWNAAQFAGTTPVEVLVSAAIAHAGYARPSFWERLQLVNFMANATR